jgi:hypothetical protein
LLTAPHQILDLKPRSIAVGVGSIVGQVYGLVTDFRVEMIHLGERNQLHVSRRVSMFGIMGVPSR